MVAMKIIRCVVRRTTDKQTDIRTYTFDLGHVQANININKIHPLVTY